MSTFMRNPISTFVKRLNICNDQVVNYTVNWPTERDIGTNNSITLEDDTRKLRAKKQTNQKRQTK